MYFIHMQRIDVTYLNSEVSWAVVGKAMKYLTLGNVKYILNKIIETIHFLISPSHFCGCNVNSALQFGTKPTLTYQTF